MADMYDQLKNVPERKVMSATRDSDPQDMHYVYQPHK